MRTLFLDFEVRALGDLDEQGAKRWLRHAQPILLAWYLVESPLHVTHEMVSQWDWFESEKLPSEFLGLLFDPGIKKSAFNAAFEIDVLEQWFGIPQDYRQWQCTMCWAYSRAFAGNLLNVGKALGLPETLLKTSGKSLLDLFCSFPYETPETASSAWEDIKQYNKQDVIAEMAIADALQKYPWSREEQETFVFDRTINNRGLPIDSVFVSKALTLIDEYVNSYLKELKSITGVENPNSRNQILAWLQNQGCDVKDLRAETVQKALDTMGYVDKETMRVMELRIAVSQAATKKYQALENRTVNGRIYDTLQAWGAGRTGRWAGRGFQQQNLKRPPRGIDPIIAANLVVDDQFSAIFS